MNLFDVLKRDHAEIRELFDHIEGLDRGFRRKLIFEEISEALLRHADLEERYLYSVLKANDQTGALDALQDHDIIERLLVELSANTSNDEEWMIWLSILRENVESHFAEEEGTLFLEASELISRRKAEQLGALLEADRSLEATPLGESGHIS
jgi:hemerythrin superfamily protein